MSRSVFLKLIVLLLAFCGCVTVIALIAKKDSGGGDSGTVKVPVVTDGTVTEPETEFGDYNQNDPVDVGNGLTQVAAQDSNSYFALSESTTRGTVRFVFCVPDLKPGAKYRLDFAFDADAFPAGVSVGTRVNEGKHGYTYRLVGNNSVTNAFSTESGPGFVVSEGEQLPTTYSILFTVNDTYYYVPDSTGKATLVFAFASVAMSEGTDYNGLAKTIIPGVTFRLYEVTA